MRHLAAMRALLGIDQPTVASACGLSVITLANAEKGQASDKTRALLLSYYAGEGVQLAPLPGGVVAITWINDIDRQAALDWIAPAAPSQGKGRKASGTDRGQEKRGSYPLNR